MYPKEKYRDGGHQIKNIIRIATIERTLTIEKK
jgi:hypothetical protein